MEEVTGPEPREDWSDEDLLTMDFSEIAARCPTVTSRSHVLIRLEELYNAPRRGPRWKRDSLGAAMEDHRYDRYLRWFTHHHAVLHEAVRVLTIFGEAIAMVAHAQVIARVAVGHSVRVDVNDECMIELWARGAAICLSEYAHNRAPRRLWQIEGQLEDNAAEAVARLIEAAQ